MILILVLVLRTGIKEVPGNSMFQSLLSCWNEVFRIRFTPPGDLCHDSASQLRCHNNGYFGIPRVWCVG